MLDGVISTLAIQGSQMTYSMYALLMSIFCTEFELIAAQLENHCSGVVHVSQKTPTSLMQKFYFRNILLPFLH